MGREGRVDGRTNAVPPERFEVDLTSVCVRRGAVQLPFRLKDAFSEGPVAAVDADGGAALALVFHTPRELAGLRAFFEAHALRANDSVGLVFTVDGLEVQAIRRERSARSRSGPSADRARPAPPAKGSPGGTPEASAAVPSPTAGDDSAARSAASQTPPSLRLEVPRASVPSVEDGPGSGSKRPVAPRWQPLDVTLATSGEYSADDAGRERSPGEQASVVVREVRRTRTEGAAAGADETALDSDTRAVRRTSAAPAASPERSQAARPSAPDARGGGSGLFGLGRRLGLGRASGSGASRDAARGGADEPTRGAAAGGPSGDGPGAAPGSRGSGVGDTAPRRPAGDSRQAAAAGRAEARDTRPAQADREGEAGLPPAVGAPHAETVTAVEEPAWEPEAASRDIAAVRTYLTGPDVPAIVRTERVAETLGMSVARAERALDRVSEGSEQLNRIRSGAYMLRRPSKA